jgi:uncharacterized protein YciI
MFIVSLTYTVPLERIDASRAAHRAWLLEQAARGVILLAGPKVPREGGILVANAASRAELEETLRGDPFHQEGLARYDITEFVPGVAAEALAAWRAA